MSHINECFYKSKIEKTEKTGSTITHICLYELINGGFVEFREVRELDKNSDFIYDGKKVESYAKASEEMPSEMIASEKDDNLKKLVELAKKYV